MTESAIHSVRQAIISIGFILLAAVCVVGVAFSIQLILRYMAVPEAMFLRFLAPFALFSIAILAVRREAILWGRWNYHAIRALFVFLGQIFYFLALQHGSLLIATTLYATSGLFVPFLSRLFFGISLSAMTLLAIAISFTGVLVMLDPAAGLKGYVVFGFLAGLLNGCSQTVQHKQTRQADALAIGFVTYAICSLLALANLFLVAGQNMPGFTSAAPVSGPAGAAGDFEIIEIFMVLGIGTVGNQIFRSLAYKHVHSPAFLTPFYYSYIAFSGLLGWIAYKEKPELHAMLGFVILLLGMVVGSLQKRLSEAIARLDREGNHATETRLATVWHSIRVRNRFHPSRHQRDYIDGFLHQAHRRVEPENVLAKVDRLVNWDAVLAILRTGTKHSSGIHKDLQVYEPLVLLKCLLLAHWHGLTDQELERALKVRLDFMLFCGLDFHEEVPGEHIHFRFRRLLVSGGIYETLLDEVCRQLDIHGLRLRHAEAAIVDATLVESAPVP
ncbi:EamA family transporter [Roseibium sp. RKSG952]|uniref:EamA family transporter n=1 Tax=Roseibium sp. RKSG952 TaxID=2529384 RepID=UPI0012BB58A1|nr:EamA family transporter [Roseibium sp. RKSG952]MTI00234.1 hypothetical protein [Roseibium sp. RKSG952]